MLEIVISPSPDDDAQVEDIEPSEERQIKYNSERRRVTYFDNTDLPLTEKEIATLSKEDLQKRQLQNRIYDALTEGEGAEESITVYSDWCLEQAVEGADIRFHNRDLRGMNLSGLYLKGVQFFECLLEGANLRGANLQEAVFEKIDLKLVELSKANLTKASFFNCRNLDKVRLSDATILSETKITTGLRQDMDQLRSSLREIGLDVVVVETQPPIRQVLEHRPPRLRGV